MLDPIASSATSVLLGLIFGASAQASLASLGVLPPRVSSNGNGWSRGFVLLALALASFGIALFELDPLNWPLFGAGALVGVVAMQVLYASAVGGLKKVKLVSGSGGFVGAALSTALWVPTVASLLTALAYLAAPPGSFAKVNAAVFGSVVALALWVIAGYVLRPFAGVGNANETSFDEILARLQVLRRRLAALANSDAPEPDPNLEMARAATDAACALVGFPQTGPEDLGRVPREELDHSPRWVLGIGYISVWHRIHQAEEALMLARDADTITDAAETLRRVTDSGFHTEASLRYQVRLAVEVYEPKAAAYFNPLEKPILGPVSETITEAADKMRAAAVSTLSDVTLEARARNMIREVRHVINDFRDSSWGSLVNERNSLVQKGILTGVAAYVLLVVAVVAAVPEAALLAAIVFYLIGAVVGLFVRLRDDTRIREESKATGVDDYGLGTVNLIVTPLACGIAAVAGVLITALIASPAVIAVISPVTAAAAEATGTTTTELPELTDIFSLKYVPGLLVAAIFGVSPNLLITRLQQQAERLKGDIQKSGPAAASTTA